MVFGRVDCKRAADHPELTPDFEQAKAICMNRGEAQGEAVAATMGYGGGLAGSVSRAITSVNVTEKTAVSCMAERGYLHKRRSEHEAFCAAYGPKPAPAVAEIAKPKKPKSTPAAGPTTATPQPAAAAPLPAQ